MSILHLFFCLFRWILPVAAGLFMGMGCATPKVITPTQAGGHHNQQQTGGIRTESPISVAPVITVPAPSTQSEGG